MGFDIYKRGQGYYTRLYSALVMFVIVAFGCYALHEKLRGINIWIETLVPVGLCVVLGILIYWLMNKPNLADFLISAEGEIKKVSWSSRREIFVSTFVVIFVVVSLTIMLFVADFVFKYLFMEIIGI
jgi:preprotein translocase subunit SecE